MTNKWQPISTAPLSGTLILLLQLGKNYVESEVDFGCWDYIERNDWYDQDIYGWTSNRGTIDEPTHWMPLPEEPEKIEEESNMDYETEKALDELFELEGWGK